MVNQFIPLPENHNQLILLPKNIATAKQSDANANI